MRSASALARGSAQNLAGLTAPLLVALVTVPFVVRELGPDRFGIVALAWTVAGYFALFDLGLGRAITKLGSEALAEVDTTRLPALLRAALVIQLGFGFLAAVVIALAAGRLAHTFHVPAALYGDARDSFRILACAIPAILIGNTYRSALEAAGRFDIVNALRAPLSSALYAVSLAGAWAGAGPRGIIALIATTRVLGALAFFLACRRALHLGGRGERDAQAWRPLLGFGSWVSVTSVLVPLTGYIDRFLVGAIASVSAVAFYAAPYELASKLLILPGSISAVLLPSLSRALHLRDSESARAQAMSSFLWSCCALFGAAALLLVLARPLLDLWLGPAYGATSTITFQLLLIAVYLNGLALIPFTMLESAGRPDLITKYHLIELPIYLAITILLIQRIGIEGAALAWVARNFVGLSLLLRLAADVRKTSVGSLLGRGSAVLAVAGAALLVAALLALQLGIPEWVVLAANAAVLLSALRWLRGRAFATATNSPAT